MAKLQYDSVNEVFVLSHTVDGANSVEHLLATENKFLDKNIKIQVNTPAVGNGILSIDDNSSTDVSVGTAAGGKYPLTANISGTMTFESAGWMSTAGDSATDTNVVVGLIGQSTLKNGNTSINSGANITPSVDGDQTINISAGYYDTNRTIIVKGASGSTAAAATVTGTTQATVPTLANTTSALTGKTQISGLPVTSDALTNEVDQYYLAVTPTAPATTVTLTKTVDTAGYLGGASQITASAATTANSQLYYIPLATGVVSASMTATTATAPTMANDNSATVSGKTRVDAAPSTDATGISTYYMAVKATAPATSVTVTKSVTGGYVTTNDVTVTGGTVAKNDTVYYIPLASGSKSAGAGAVSATSSTVDITETNTEPLTGYYITATGSGSANIESGWFNAATSQSSNTATKYYTIPPATFNVSGSAITVATAGYIGVGDSVGTISAGVLSTGLTDRTSQGYTTLADNSVVIPTDESGHGGYLYIPAGYYNSTQISLGTLIPDSATSDAVSANILSGYEAYTTNGTRLVGSIATYDGEYTTT